MKTFKQLQSEHEKIRSELDSLQDIARTIQQVDSSYSGKAKAINTIYSLLIQKKKTNLYF